MPSGSGTISLLSIVGLTGTGNGTNSLTYTGTVAAINAALTGLSYTAPGTVPATNPFNLTVTYNDQGNTGSGGTLTVTQLIPMNVVQKAALEINTIMAQAPGTNQNNQYVEIRAVPGLNGNSYSGGVYTIPQGTYLVGVNGAGGAGANPGGVNYRFDISGMQTGSNGVLLLLQNQNPYYQPGFFDALPSSGSGPTLAPLANAVIPVNAGFGNNSIVADPSAVGFATDQTQGDGEISSGSISWFLLQTATVSEPAVRNGASVGAPGADIDPGDNGVIAGNDYNNWVVLDSVGSTSSDNATKSFAYAAVDFINAAGLGTPILTATAAAIDFTPGAFIRPGTLTSASTAINSWLATASIDSNVDSSGSPANGSAIQATIGDLSSLPGFSGVPLDVLNGAGNVATSSSIGAAIHFADATGTVASTSVTPVVDLNGAAVDGRNSFATFTQGGGAVTLSSIATVTDVGLTSDTIHSATVTITPVNGVLDPSEVLAVTTLTGYSQSYSNGVLTITTTTGSGSLANYQTMLSGVSYNNPTPTNFAQRNIVFQVTDNAASPGPYTSAPSTVTLNLYGNTLPAVRINEIDVTPGGGANGFANEYIEIIGPAGTSLSNYYLADVQGNATNPLTTTTPQFDGQTGWARYVANLSGFSIGSNGLLIITGAHGFSAPSGTTVVSDPLFDQLVNGVHTSALLNASGQAQSFLLINSPTVPITSYTVDTSTDPSTVTGTGTDFDTSGAGTTFDSGNLTLPSGAQLVDSVGWANYTFPHDLTYGSVVLPSLLSGVPQVITRFPGNLSHSASAWYYGDLNPGSGSQTQYNGGLIVNVPASSANLPAGAILTPGAANFPFAAAPTVTTTGGNDNYTIDAAGVVVDSGVTLTDGTSSPSLSATVSITGGFQSGDKLNFTTQNGISGAYNASTGVLTLTGGGSSVANYQSALQSITFSSTSTNTATRTVSFTATDGLTSPAATKSIAVLPFEVTSFTPNANGFSIGLDAAPDFTKLNLYEGENDVLGPADMTVLNGSTPVTGSLVWDPTTMTATFVADRGALGTGNYSVSLASRTDGWVDTHGNLLGGGTNYTNSFTIAAPGTPILTIPNFARGPGQSVDVGDASTNYGTAATTTLPVALSSTTGVTSVSFQVAYNTSDLTVTNATLAAGISGTLVLNTSTPGLLGITITGFSSTATANALGGGTNIVDILASVPTAAISTYGASALVKVVNPMINGTASTPTDSVEKVAYFGDATGDGTLSGLDASFIARNQVLLDNGFSAYPLTSPLLVGDVTGDGSLSGLDASFVAQKSVQLTVANIPAIPSHASLVAAGVDPTISVPVGITATAGQAAKVNVPIGIVDDADGLMAADLTITYDPALLSIASSGVSLNSDLANLGWSITRNVSTAGVIHVTLFSTGDPLGAGPQQLLTLAFSVPSGPSGTSAISVSGSLNTGGLTLSTNSGSVIVKGNQPIPVAPVAPVSNPVSSSLVMGVSLSGSAHPAVAASPAAVSAAAAGSPDGSTGASAGSGGLNLAAVDWLLGGGSKRKSGSGSQSGAVDALLADGSLEW